MSPPPPLLVIEDDPTIARALRRELKASGFECILARTAEEARATNYSGVAIVDINLPDGNGLDLIEELRAEGRITNSVFFSATRDPLECERAQRLGKFVPKSRGVEAAVATALQIFRTTTPPSSTTRLTSKSVPATSDDLPADDLPAARDHMRNGSDS